MARAAALAEVETYPEPDKLDGFPHPRATARLYGHETAERTLAEAFASGRMHHAWLLAGPEGIGKATLAYRFATFALARADERDMFGTSLDVPLDSSASRQVKAQSHPELLILRRPWNAQKKRHATEITIDEVRRVKAFLALTAADDAWRVVIVDPADEMNINAANGLLKALEEPPKRTVFLLVSSSPAGLLATVRSRCRTLHLSPLAGDDLKKAVQQAIVASDEDIGHAAMPEPGEWADLERLSGGSVRRLLGLKASGGLDLNKRMMTLVGSLPKLDWEGVHKLADELASPAAEQRYELFYQLLSGLVARIVRAATQSAGADGEVELAKRLNVEGKLATWAELWETATREKAVADALNLDRKGLILETFSRLEALSRG